MSRGATANSPGRNLPDLLSQARVYVGPDTSVTHLAAAAGCPTVALYGPTDPRLWGPWPVGGLDQIWEAAGTIAAPRECLVGAKPVALHAVPTGRLRAAARQLQHMPR